MCSQGQQKSGVDEGALYLYNNVFKEVCEEKPYVIRKKQFDTQDGYQKLFGVCRKSQLPLVIGGDRSISSSAVLASIQRFRDLQVIYIDAHPDINTYESTATGNTHGTVMAVCTGLEKKHWASRISLKLLLPKNLIYVGVRDIDSFEREQIDLLGIKNYTYWQAVDFIN